LGNYERNKYLYFYGLGCGINGITTAITYPIDVVRKRMIVISGSNLEYDHSRHAFKQIWKKEGIRGFYGGFSLHLLMGLVSAIILVPKLNGDKLDKK